MQIQVNTDGNVDGSDDRAGRIEGDVATALARFEDRLTRVEVHLRDESAGRPTSGDHRCLIEARPAGMEPVVVSDHADGPEEAVNGALDKLVGLLQSKFDRLADKRGHDSIRRRES